MPHLHHLQTSFNSKVTDMKEAADLLSEYTKKSTVTVTIKDVANTATQPPPVVQGSTTIPHHLQPMHRKKESAPLHHGGRMITCIIH